MDASTNRALHICFVILSAAKDPRFKVCHSLPFRCGGAYPDVLAQLRGIDLLDWADCPLIEVIPDKVSGVPLLKGTRLPAATIVQNFEGGSPIEEIAENFDVPEETLRELLSYAARHENPPQP